MRWIRLALVALLLLVFAGAAPTSAQSSVPRFEPGACPFLENPGFVEGKNLRCGYLVVPENRGAANGRTIRLAVAIFRPKTVKGQDPVFFLSGGPGDPLLSVMGLAISRSNAAVVMGDHPLVLLDQRGTGYSQPFLGCSEQTDAAYQLLNSVDRARQVRIVTAALRACHDRLVGEGIDLSAYSTIEDAADVNDLRLALGYKQIDLYGLSYGTRLAETVMRLYPEGIRSVVLDSVVPLQENLELGGPAAMAHAYQVLFAGCAGDSTCSHDYPHLSAVFDRTIQRLDDHPIHIQVGEASTNVRFKVAFNGPRFAALVFGLQYSAAMIPMLPNLIWQVDHGKYGLLSTLAGYVSFPHRGEGDGMRQSVFCGEDVAFVTPDQIAAAQQPLPAPLRADALPGIAGDPNACKIWNVSPVPAAQKQPLSSTIPTLILDGEYDPITPPSNGELAQATLPNSYRFVYPGVGHWVRWVAACPNSMVNAFFDHPDQKPDDACIASMSEPGFQARSGKSLAGGSSRAIDVPLGAVPAAARDLLGS